MPRSFTRVHLAVEDFPAAGGEGVEAPQGQARRRDGGEIDDEDIAVLGGHGLVGGEVEVHIPDGDHILIEVDSPAVEDGLVTPFGGEPFRDGVLRRERELQRPRFVAAIEARIAGDGVTARVARPRVDARIVVATGHEEEAGDRNWEQFDSFHDVLGVGSGFIPTREWGDLGRSFLGPTRGRAAYLLRRSPGGIRVVRGRRARPN